MKKGDRVKIRTCMSNSGDFSMSGNVMEVHWIGTAGSCCCYPASVSVLHDDGEERDWRYDQLIHGGREK